MKIRNFGWLSMMLLVAILIISGCAASDNGAVDGPDDDGRDDGEGGEGEATTVKMIFWPGPESDAMEKVIDHYNSNQGVDDGVHVDMVLISRGGTFEREATMMQSNSDEVDMYFTTSYILGQHADNLEALDEDLTFDNYLETSINSLKMNDETLAVPTDISSQDLIYRTDLMDELLTNDEWIEQYKVISEDIIGIEMEPKEPENWNWDDYLATAAFFTERINEDSPTRYGTSISLLGMDMNMTFWNNILWSEGGNWLDENGNPEFLSDASVKATEIFTTMYEKGIISPDSPSEEFPEKQAAIKTGSAAFTIQWTTGFMELDDPEESPEVAGKLAIAPVPGGNAHVHSNAIGLNKYSNNKEAALKWMDYLTTIEAMKIYATYGGIVPMTEVLEQDDAENSVLPIISEHVEEYGYSLPSIVETYEILQILSNELPPAWVGTEDIDKALTNIQNRVEELLE